MAGACPTKPEKHSVEDSLAHQLVPAPSNYHHSHEDNLRAENWLWVPIQALPQTGSVSLDEVVNSSVPCSF